MLKLPKGLKKKKKKSKKDQELFTEEELEQYKRDLKAKQEAAANKSDAGESDGAASEAETSHDHHQEHHHHQQEHSHQVASSSGSGFGGQEEDPHHHHLHSHSQGAGAAAAAAAAATGGDEEWAKFKALTSGVDSILHKTQDELDRIKKESFYQRLPSAAEKKKQEEEEAARREEERLERERQRLAQIEAQRDKLAEAVVQLSESEDEHVDDEADDIFATDYIEAITSGEIQLAVVPDSPVFAQDDGPDPFDTAYAEKVIVGADRSKGNKKLVSLGAAVEVLSGRVDREHAVALANPKRKLRKGIQNLLLSESVELADPDSDLLAGVEPQQHNLLDDLDEELPESSAPIDLSVSLHLHLIKPKPKEEDDDDEEEENREAGLHPDLSEFDALKDEEDDEFAELAAESLTKKEEVTIVSQVHLPAAELPSEASWAEFEPEPEPEPETGKPKRPPPPVRPATGPHIVPGAIYVSDDDEDLNPDDDPFNTNYAEQVIKKTTVLEEDDDFDPRAEEPAGGGGLAAPARDLLAGSATDLSQVVPAPLAPTLSVDQEPEDFDPFDTSAVSALVQPKATELRFLERELLNEAGGGSLKHSLSDPDFDPRAGQDEGPQAQQPKEHLPQPEDVAFDAARRKSSLSLNIQAKSVGFLVPAPDLLGVGNEPGANKKPLTPYYAPTGKPIEERERESEEVDPFDTSYVPEAKLSDIELKHIEKDLAQSLRHSLSDPDFDPRAPPTPVPAEVLLAVEENINIKVLTPAQERKKLTKRSGGNSNEDDEDEEEDIDPFDTSIAANLRPGETELKLLENELLPETQRQAVTDVLDVQSDAQELGLGDKVLTPSTHTRPQLPGQEDIDPFDTSIAENLGPGETEIKLLESELIER
ncbi:hypothetical protein KR054_000880 [Drosophila jambulina]|nr:hypothetical protein KR054_000880 [Drosophila jambulina]